MENEVEKLKLKIESDIKHIFELEKDIHRIKYRAECKILENIYINKLAVCKRKKDNLLDKLEENNSLPFLGSLREEVYFTVLQTYKIKQQLKVKKGKK